MRSPRRALCLAALVLAPATARAGEETCVVLCRPALKLEPTLTIGGLIGPEVEDVMTGATRRLSPEPGFELVFALGIPTQIPRVRFTLEGILPIPVNRPELEAELNLMLVTEEMTAGWVGAHIDVVGQLSPGKRPGSQGSYTHKLDFELDVALLAFNGLPAGNWLRNVEIEASLDYLATGLPRRGDVLDGERYLEDGTGWSLSLLLVLPLAPLVPE
jgi:hypothetical protein